MLTISVNHFRPHIGTFNLMSKQVCGSHHSLFWPLHNSTENLETPRFCIGFKAILNIEVRIFWPVHWCCKKTAHLHKNEHHPAFKEHFHQKSSECQTRCTSMAYKHDLETQFPTVHWQKEETRMAVKSAAWDDILAWPKPFRYPLFWHYIGCPQISSWPDK